MLKSTNILHVDVENFTFEKLWTEKKNEILNFKTLRTYNSRTFHDHAHI